MAITKKLRRYIPSDPEFQVEEFPFYWLARVQGIYTQKMETALKRIGTDIPTWRVLFILKTHGTSSISEGTVTGTEPVCRTSPVQHFAHADAVANCQAARACARKVRRVRRETKWRWRLKVL